MANMRRLIPTFVPTTAAETAVFQADRAGTKSQVSGVRRLRRKPGTSTQIYESTNQIQRVVIAKGLLS
jgi:hypothetical protein